MSYIAHFEVTNQGGNLFRHSEEFRICGLARVRVREDKDQLWNDWSGVVRRYRATSSRPFVVCILSDHTIENRDGSFSDLSEVREVKAELQ